MGKISMSLWVQTNAQLNQGTMTQTFFNRSYRCSCAVFKWQDNQGTIYALPPTKDMYSLLLALMS